MSSAYALIASIEMARAKTAMMVDFCILRYFVKLIFFKLIIISLCKIRQFKSVLGAYYILEKTVKISKYQKMKK